MWIRALRHLRPALQQARPSPDLLTQTPSRWEVEEAETRVKSLSARLDAARP